MQEWVYFAIGVPIVGILAVALFMLCFRRQTQGLIEECIRDAVSQHVSAKVEALSRASLDAYDSFVTDVEQARTLAADRIGKTLASQCTQPSFPSDPAALAQLFWTTLTPFVDSSVGYRANYLTAVRKAYDELCKGLVPDLQALADRLTNASASRYTRLPSAFVLVITGLCPLRHPKSARELRSGYPHEVAIQAIERLQALWDNAVSTQLCPLPIGVPPHHPPGDVAVLLFSSPPPFPKELLVPPPPAAASDEPYVPPPDESGIRENLSQLYTFLLTGGYLPDGTEGLFASLKLSAGIVSNGFVSLAELLMPTALHAWRSAFVATALRDARSIVIPAAVRLLCASAQQADATAVDPAVDAAVGEGGVIQPVSHPFVPKQLHPQQSVLGSGMSAADAAQLLSLASVPEADQEHYTHQLASSLDWIHQNGNARSMTDRVSTDKIKRWRDLALLRERLVLTDVFRVVFNHAAPSVIEEEEQRIADAKAKASSESQERDACGDAEAIESKLFTPTCLTPNVYAQKLLRLLPVAVSESTQQITRRVAYYTAERETVFRVAPMVPLVIHGVLCYARSVVYTAAATILPYLNSVVLRDSFVRGDVHVRSDAAIKVVEDATDVAASILSIVLESKLALAPGPLRDAVPCVQEFALGPVHPEISRAYAPINALWRHLGALLLDDRPGFMLPPASISGCVVPSTMSALGHWTRCTLTSGILGEVIQVFVRDVVSSTTVALSSSRVVVLRPVGSLKDEIAELSTFVREAKEVVARAVLVGELCDELTSTAQSARAQVKQQQQCQELLEILGGFAATSRRVKMPANILPVERLAGAVKWVSSKLLCCPFAPNYECGEDTLLQATLGI